MSEPREERVRPPEHVHLYAAPGMDTVSFSELLMGAGIRRDLGEMLDNMNMQIASLQDQINQLRAQVGMEQPEPQQEPAPEPEPPPQPPARPMAGPPRRPHR